MSRILCNVVIGGCITYCVAGVLIPMLMTVLFGSWLKTPARSQAICISFSVRPLLRRNFCFWLRGLRWTLLFCRNCTAVFIWNDLAISGFSVAWWLLSAWKRNIPMILWVEPPPPVVQRLYHLDPYHSCWYQLIDEFWKVYRLYSCEIKATFFGINSNLYLFFTSTLIASTHTWAEWHFFDRE